jgi:hypothetical protein
VVIHEAEETGAQEQAEGGIKMKPVSKDPAKAFHELEASVEFIIPISQVGTNALFVCLVQD